MKKNLLSFVCASAILAGAWNVCAQEAGAPLPPPGGDVPPHHEMMKRPPHHERMKHAPRPEKNLAKELGLTAEQEEQARKIREDGREKMKPLMDEIKKVHEKMNELRKENMEEFEKILTPEQKDKFAEIKKKMEERRPHKGPKGPKGPKGELEPIAPDAPEIPVALDKK